MNAYRANLLINELRRETAELRAWRIKRQVNDIIAASIARARALREADCKREGEW